MVLNNQEKENNSSVECKLTTEDSFITDLIPNRIQRLLFKKFDPETFQRLEKINQLAQEANKNCYILTVDSKKWVVIADENSINKINLSTQYLKSLTDFMSTKKGSELGGSCLFIHRDALEEGLIDGTLSAIATPKFNEDYSGVYPISGMHFIGRKKIKGTDFAIDLISKSYAFSSLSVPWIPSVAEGLITINDSTTLETTMRSDWEESTQRTLPYSWVIKDGKEIIPITRKRN